MPVENSTENLMLHYRCFYTCSFSVYCVVNLVESTEAKTVAYVRVGAGLSSVHIHLMPINNYKITPSDCNLLVHVFSLSRNVSSVIRSPTPPPFTPLPLSHFVILSAFFLPYSFQALLIIPFYRHYSPPSFLPPFTLRKLTNTWLKCFS
jgi:hypothetical protein